MNVGKCWDKNNIKLRNAEVRRMLRYVKAIQILLGYTT